MAVIVNPVNGQSASAFDAGDVSGMLVRFANQTIAGADIPVQYPEFERTVEEYGSILADVRIPAPQGYEPNPDTTDICGPYYFNVDASYSQPWKQAQYAMEFRRVDLTKAVGDQAAFNDLLSRIMNATREGYQAEVNTAMEDAFLLGGADSSVKTALINYHDGSHTISSALSYLNKGWLNTTSRYKVLDTPTWDDIVTEIRNTVDDMRRANSNYLGKTEDGVTSKAGVNGYGARIEDLVVLMPYWLYNRMDTAYLQTLIRLQSVEAFPPIIKYGGRMTLATSQGVTPVYYPIIIMDRRVLLHVVRHMEYVSEDVRCRWSTVYQLNVEHGIKYCPWYKAYAIVTPMPTANNVGQLNVAGIRAAVAYEDPSVYGPIQQNVARLETNVSDIREAVAAPDPSSYTNTQTTIVSALTKLTSIDENTEALRTGTVDANPSGKATIQTSVVTGTQAAAASAEPAAEPPAEATPDTKATGTKTSK